MIEPKFSAAVAAFHRAADAVAAVLGANQDWGASGVREGQYAVDLEADRVCLDVLYGAGYRVLSEESGITGPPGSESAPIVVVDPLDGSTNASDFGILAIVTAPFLTGLLAYYQVFDARVMTILHMLAGETMLIAIPFTRLSHMIFAPFVRGYTASEFGAVRMVKDY